MRNQKVAVRLAVAFALLLALLLGAVAVAILGVRAASEQASRLERENVAMLNAVGAMRVAQLNEAVAIRDFVGQENVDRQRAAYQALLTSEKAYAQSVATLERLSTDDAAIRPLVARLKAASAPVSARLREAMDLSEQAEYPQAQAIVYNDVRPLQEAIARDLEALAQSSNTLARQRADSSAAAAQDIQRRLLVVAFVALLVGAVATDRITRGIVQPLGTALAVAERVADGDLRAVQVSAGQDEAGRLLAALAAMQERLNALVRAIRESAEAVVQGSGHIAGSNSELAARTEQQAAALEETAASVEELTAVVQQNSGNAAQARTLAAEAARLAADGGSAVQRVVRTMDGIQASSRNVSEIVGVMDEIAFQTNLLALNAAVEAARAGEHGRGFGVVAQQVRLLAQRSGEASRDIRKLVGQAVGEADQGARAAAAAGESMARAVGVAQDLARLVADIAQGSTEQRTGIEQVNATIAQMDTATQGNAALVQDVNTQIEALLAQARELAAATSRFRLDEGQAAQEHRGAFGSPAYAAA